MKVLLLPLALLLLTGAQGKHFWQGDEPKHEDSVQTIQKVFQKAVAIVTNVVKNMEYSEIAKEYKLKEKLQAAKDNADQLETVLEDYFDVIWKKWDEELKEKFPVFRNKVLPILQDFDDKLEEQMKTLVEEVVPIGSQLYHGIAKHLDSFFENLGTITEKSRDSLRAEVDILRGKLQPYVDDVRAEYEKYSKDMKDGLDDKAKEMKEQVEKQAHELREKIKPYIESLKKHAGSSTEEAWKYLETLLKDLNYSKDK